MTDGPSNELRIILLTSIGHALCHIAELAFTAVILFVMSEFDLPADRAALLVVPGFVLYGVAAVPAGIWTDRKGCRTTMTAYFILVILASLSVFLANSIWTLCAGLTFLGAAISIYHPAGLAMISHGCPNRGRAMGINGVAGSFGVALGPALGLYMVSHYSWRATYLVIAAIGVIGLMCAVLMRYDIPSHDSTSRRASNGGRGGAWLILVPLFLAMTVGGFNYRCVTTVLPTYLSGIATDGKMAANDSVSESTEQPDKLARGSRTVFLVLALGGIGQLAGGFLADRFRTSALYTIMIVATIPFALLMARTSVETGTWLAGALAIFMFAEQPLENTMIAEATPPKWRSTVYGLKFILAFGVASMGVYVAGLVGRYRLADVFYVYAIGAALMATLAGVYATFQRSASKTHRVA